MKENLNFLPVMWCFLNNHPLVVYHLIAFLLFQRGKSTDPNGES